MPTPFKGRIEYLSGGGFHFQIDDSMADDSYRCKDTNWKNSLSAWLVGVKGALEREVKLSSSTTVVILSTDSFYVIVDELSPNIVIHPDDNPDEN